MVPDAVVDPIANAIDVKAPDVGGTGFFDYSADIRLDEQEVQGVLQILPDGAGRGWPVGGPPLNDAFDLSRGAARDVQRSRHRYS
jgi:hypothetical protein